MKSPQVTDSTPRPFAFDTLEDQTACTLNILRVLELACLTELQFERDERQAVAGLLYHVRELLEPLNLEEAAGDLDNAKREALKANRKEQRSA